LKSPASVAAARLLVAIRAFLDKKQRPQGLHFAVQIKPKLRPPLQLAAPSQGIVGPAFDCQMIVRLQS